MEYNKFNLPIQEEDNAEFKKFLAFIQKSKGIDLASYRENFLKRRIYVRMYANKVQDYSKYIDIIDKDPEEYNRFLDTLGINVSEFFRNADVFEAFSKDVLLGLVEKKKASNQRIIRIWSAGCASGEEAYSLAILLKETLGEDIKNFMLRLWGTDIDRESLSNTQIAEYPKASLKEVDPKLIEKYFTALPNEMFRLKDEIKNMVKFSPHNLVNEPILKFMDVIFCRNVIIYFTRQQQELLMRNFYNALNYNGYLVLGKIENIWDNKAFTCTDRRNKIYRVLKDRPWD